MATRGQSGRVVPGGKGTPVTSSMQPSTVAGNGAGRGDSGAGAEAAPTPTLAASGAAQAVGGELLRRFQVLGVLGSGTFGHVYKLRRKSDGRICVLKQVVVAGLAPKDLQDTFNEAQVMSKIRHRHVIQYFESFLEHGRLKIVMEFAPGGDLAAAVARRKASGKPFTEEELWRILVGITQGLQHIHAARILHRDVKPSNIFLDALGDVKIGDFGLGRMLGPQSRFATTAVGTPLYFSPELVEEREYNERTDMWSLGCLMYELAALRPPFLASNHLALAKKIVSDTPEELPRRYSKQFRFLIKKLLEKSAAKRPDSSHVLHYEPVQFQIKLAAARRQWQRTMERRRQEWAALATEANAREMAAVKRADEAQDQVRVLRAQMASLRREKLELQAAHEAQLQQRAQDTEAIVAGYEQELAVAHSDVLHSVQQLQAQQRLLRETQTKLLEVTVGRQRRREAGCQTDAVDAGATATESHSATQWEQGLASWQAALRRTSDLLLQITSHHVQHQSRGPPSDTSFPALFATFVSSLRDVDAACRRVLSVKSSPQVSADGQADTTVTAVAGATVTAVPVPQADTTVTAVPVPQAGATVTAVPVPQADTTVTPVPVPQSDSAVAAAPVPQSDSAVAAVGTVPATVTGPAAKGDALPAQSPPGAEHMPVCIPTTSPPAPDDSVDDGCCSSAGSSAAVATAPRVPPRALPKQHSGASANVPSAASTLSGAVRGKPSGLSPQDLRRLLAVMREKGIEAEPSPQQKVQRRGHVTASAAPAGSTTIVWPRLTPPRVPRVVTGGALPLPFAPSSTPSSASGQRVYPVLPMPLHSPPEEHAVPDQPLCRRLTFTDDAGARRRNVSVVPAAPILHDAGQLALRSPPATITIRAGGSGGGRSSHSNSPDSSDVEQGSPLTQHTAITSASL